MIDLTQLLIALVILVLTSLLTIVGFQVYLILREFRATIQKANKVLDDTGVISESVSKPVSMLSSIMLGLRGGTKIMQALTKEKEKKHE
ncbi:MAG: hypothetical protein M1484_01665 [Patescibacteria group bacterium]|nr:hypothetical protein [Patescibacteria group bacterium]MCL5431787.1 hypothetical protein [Patescibacteria group bacterium]